MKTWPTQKSMFFPGRGKRLGGCFIKSHESIRSPLHLSSLSDHVVPLVSLRCCAHGVLSPPCCRWICSPTSAADAVWRAQLVYTILQDATPLFQDRQSRRRRRTTPRKKYKSYRFPQATQPTYLHVEASLLEELRRYLLDRTTPCPPFLNGSCKSHSVS